MKRFGLKNVFKIEHVYSLGKPILIKEKAMESRAPSLKSVLQRSVSKLG